VSPESDGAFGSRGERVDPSLSPEQRAAFEQWQEVHRLDRSGDLALTTQAVRPTMRTGLPAGTARVVGLGGIAYLACIVLVGVAFGARGTNASRSYAALAALIVAGAGAALAAGRAGPADAVRIRHSSLLQQIPGTEGSLFTVHAIAEFPAFATYGVELRVADATIEASSPTGRAEQIFNDAGHPVLTGTYGLAARQAFVAEGIADVQPLGVTISGRQARVANRSSQALHDCRFGDGFSIAAVGTLEPGAMVSAEQVGEGIGPMFTCTMAELPVAFHESRRAVETSGVTIVAAYRPARVSAND
jgi:hypothetical protein